MGNDSKLGMLIGLAVVVAVAFLVYPKVAENSAGGPVSTLPSISPNSSRQTDASLTSQVREARKPLR
jgi:hypothetical protein